MGHGHAHPSTESPPPSLASTDLNRQPPTRGPLSFLGVPNTSSPLQRSSQALIETPLSLPQRRLQLRNAGFRAPRLPSHRLSTKISRWFSDKDGSHSQRSRSPARSRPTSPSTVRRKNTRGNHTPSSILHEITNSGHSRRSDKSTFEKIYEDDQDHSPTHSWYHDSPTTQQSPMTSDAVKDNATKMKLKEISGNAQRSPPPLSSPLARQIRSRNKRSLNPRKTSFPASEHIVFLETKLEEVEKSQYSPNTGLPLADKNKALTAESNRLREMLAELEHQFEARLRESVEHKTGVEMNLRRRVKQLEEEIGLRDCTIRDLEHRNDASQRDLSNADAYKAAVERLESELRGLSETNRSLEKRNDILTELLGQSPTRSQQGFDLPSPLREHQRRTPRPRSMMPRIPSSPAHNALNRPLSLHTFPAPPQPDYFSPASVSARQPNHAYDDEDVSPFKDIDDSQSVDSGLGESCSVRSGNEPVSKRSSMRSQASGSLAGWAMPLPASPTEEYVERSARKRKTRRFASGSTQLKPLVLPSLGTTASLPQSAPLPAPYSSQSRRDISERSLDPTLSFLSPVQDTPTQSSRTPHLWASEDALKALEPCSEVRAVSCDEGLPDRELSQSPTKPALGFQNLAFPSSDSFDLSRLSPNLVDEVILEEDAMVFSNGSADVCDQLFRDVAGELSVAESKTHRPCVKKQASTAQSVDSELPSQMDLQLHSFSACPQLLNQFSENEDTRTDDLRHESPSEQPFRLVAPVERDFGNPLANPYLLPKGSFRHSEDVYQTESKSEKLDIHGIPSSQDSLAEYSSERPVQPQKYSADIALQMADVNMPNPLQAAPPHSVRKMPRRPNSPLELLQGKGSPTASLTSVTIRTTFGTISRYTSYMREIRRDPTALARRVIANAWWSNWRRLGKLSWWVLGLFLGPGWEQQVKRKQGWEEYDGENIAQAEHERLNGPGPILIQDAHHDTYYKLTSPRQSTESRHKGAALDGHAQGTKPSPENDILDAQNVKCRSCEQKRKTSWRRSLYLWGKFSIAIILAVGGAVIKGPEEMLKGCESSPDAASERPSEQFCTQQNPDEAERDGLFSYPPEVCDDDLGHGKIRSSESARTAKSATCSRSRREQKPPPLPQSGPLFPSDSCHHPSPALTPNSPDRFDKYNQHSRPNTSRRTRHAAERDQPKTPHSPSDPSLDPPGLTTLHCVQSPSVQDSESFQDGDDV